MVTIVKTFKRQTKEQRSIVRLARWSMPRTVRKQLHVLHGFRRDLWVLDHLLLFLFFSDEEWLSFSRNDCILTSRFFSVCVILCYMCFLSGWIWRALFFLISLACVYFIFILLLSNVDLFLNTFYERWNNTQPADVLNVSWVIPCFFFFSENGFEDVFFVCFWMMNRSTSLERSSNWFFAVTIAYRRYCWLVIMR